jgi:hypothetical protein
VRLGVADAGDVWGGLRLAWNQCEAPMIKGLHHNAYRCRTPRKRANSTRTSSDCGLSVPSKSTRGVASTVSLRWTTDRAWRFLRFQGRPFDFKRQGTSDLHIALGC